MKKWLIYDIRQVVEFPDGTNKTIKINMPHVITDDVDKFKKRLLNEVKKVHAYKDCRIEIFLTYNEVENEFLS